MARREMTVDEARAHAGGSLKAVPAEIRRRVKDDLPHYIWVIDMEGGRERAVWCEWCECLRYETKRGGKWPQPLPQGETVTCHACGGKAIAKHTSRKFSGLRDRLEVIWYQVSATDPDAIMAFGAFVDRDFMGADEERPWTLDAEIDVRSCAVIRWGEDGWRFSEQVTGWTPFSGPNGGWMPGGKKWVPVKRLGCLTFGDTAGPMVFGAKRPERLLYEDTLGEAIGQTPFARAWHPDYLLLERGLDGVEALTRIARYPCIEYMSKLGMTEFLPECLLGYLPANMINWRGRTMAAVLKLPKGRLGEMKGAGITATPALVAVLKWMEANGLRLEIRAAKNVATLMDRKYNAGVIATALGRVLADNFPASRWRKALKYMARQLWRMEPEEEDGRAPRAGRSRRHAARITIGDFEDYWRLVRNLGDSLADDAVAFPGDLRAAEQRCEARRDREREAMEALKNKDNDDAIRNRLPVLEKRFGFAFGGLILRPAKDAAEVVAEGKALHHCVGGYVRRYAQGETVICVLRRAVEPDKPWRTVEISARTGRLVQDRGYHNDTAGLGIPLDSHYRAALECFWSAWKERKTA